MWRHVPPALESRLARFVRQRRPAPPIHVEEIVLRSTAGLQLEGHVHTLGEAGRRPAVLLCPGRTDPGTVFDGWRAPVRADEIAAMGAVVLHFDPAGRGKSWGHEDHGGPEHQDEVAVAVRALLARDDVDPERIGVVSIGEGLSMALGAVDRVRWLLDWEGPCDQETLAAAGVAVTGAHELDDAGWWAPREAVRHVARLRCGYLRLQGSPDHALPGETRHATRMLHAAAQAPGLAWFQINDHPRGDVPPRPLWIEPGTWMANRTILRKVRTLMES
jgi:hypothetical protein